MFWKWGAEQKTKNRKADSFLHQIGIRFDCERFFRNVRRYFYWAAGYRNMCHHYPVTWCSFSFMFIAWYLKMLPKCYYLSFIRFPLYQTQKGKTHSLFRFKESLALLYASFTYSFKKPCHRSERINLNLFTLENDLRRHAHPSAHVDEVGEEVRWPPIFFYTESDLLQSNSKKNL